MNPRLRIGLFALLPMVLGCTNLTEYDASYQAGLYVVSAPDFAIVSSLGPIEGGRSVCPAAGRIWVATTQGNVLSYSTTGMALENTWSIGQPSPSAYGEMVFSYEENSVYLIGPRGMLIELAYPSGITEETFSPCEAPKTLTISDDGQFLYLVDGATDRLLEVRLSTNHTSRVRETYGHPLCLCNSMTRTDTLVMGTTEGSVLVSAAGVGIIKQWKFDDWMILDVTGIPDDSIHCGIRRLSSFDEVVTLRSFFPDSVGQGAGWLGGVPLQGDAHILCPGTDRTHAYVLSYVGNSTSRLVSYDHDEYRIDGEMDIPGYPVDMQMTPSGNLAILTAQ